MLSKLYFGFIDCNRKYSHVLGGQTVADKDKIYTEGGDERLQTEKSSADDEDNKYLNSYLNNYVKEFEDEKARREEEEKANACKSCWGTNLTIRLQSLTCNVFSSEDKHIQINNRKKPAFEIFVKVIEYISNPFRIPALILKFSKNTKKSIS